MGSMKHGLSAGPSNTSNSFVARNPSEQVRGFMSLPMEIVLVVAWILSNTGRLSELAAFARLLKLEWRYTHAIQEVLFSRIHLDTYERCANLARTLQLMDTPQHSRQLARMVRNVSATLNAQPAPGRQPFLPEHALNLFGLCPELTEVTVAGVHVCWPHAHSIQTVGNIFPVERLVRLQCLTINCPLEPLALLLLRYLPNLTELRIVGGCVRFQLADSPPLSGPRLRRLTWASETPPDTFTISWLFGHCTDATGGEIVLVTPPYMDLQLELIRDYALQRRMNFCSPPASSTVQGAA